MKAPGLYFPIANNYTCYIDTKKNNEIILILLKDQCCFLI